jgi:FkbM family methyltransferase
MRKAPFSFRYFPKWVFWWRLIWGANKEQEMKLLDILCDPTRTGVDIGAKIGMYTYRIRAQCADVIAFEPIPLFNHLLRAVFEGNRARIEPYAISRGRGHAVMRVPYDHDGTRRFGRSTIDSANPLVHRHIARVEELNVETRSLDDYKLSNVGFIKIDVEGHELAVLEGAAQTIESERPVMLIECNDDHHPGAVERLAGWLRERNYDGLFIDGHAVQSIERYDQTEHWLTRRIGHFICIHRSQADVRERLKTRVASYGREGTRK